MSVEFKFDLVPGWSARRTAELTEITRPCLIRNMPIAAGASDPEVLLKVTDDPSCPAYGDVFPTTKPLWAGCTLQDIVITSRPNNTSAQANFVYRRKTDHGDSTSAGAWSVTYGTTLSHVTTYATSDGSDLIKVWYKPGEASTTVTLGDYPGLPAKKGRSVAVHQMRATGYLRATGLLKADDWLAIKPDMRRLRGQINAAQWGGDAYDERGKWFYVGPTTRTTDFGKSYTVDLEFLEAEDLFFPWAIWHQKDGSHPGDAAPEAAFGSPPSAGFVTARNGRSRCSAYKEFDFGDYFSFTP